MNHSTKVQTSKEDSEVNYTDRTRQLSVLQQKFVEEYLIDLNGTQAAVRAGYSPRSALRRIMDWSLEGDLHRMLTFEYHSIVWGLKSKVCCS